MGRRLSTPVDTDDPLFEEMLERNPPVIDGIKLSDSDIPKLLDVSETVGTDGKRIVELLGVPRDGGPVERDHQISQPEQKELLKLLDELIDGIAVTINTEYELSELACKSESTQREIAGEYGPVLLSVYLKAVTIRDLVSFASEKEIDIHLN